MVESLRLEMNFLSPIHIGSNNTALPYEYYMDRNVVYLLDLNKLLSISKIADFFKQNIFNQLEEKSSLASLNSKTNILYKQLAEKNKLEIFSVDSIKITDTVLRYLSDATSRERQGKESLRQIILFPRNPFPYIPGSSIKGAIRTGFLDFLAENDKNCGHFDKKAQKLEHCLLGGLSEKGKGEATALFYKTYFQYIFVEDVSVKGKTSIVRVGNHSMTKRNRSSIETNREVIFSKNRDDLIQLNVNIDVQRCKKSAGKDMDFKKILRGASSSYVRKMEEDLNRIKKSVLNNKDEIVSFYENIINEVNTSSELYLLRLGWGSGYNSVTIKKYRRIKGKPAQFPIKGKPGQGWGYSINLAERRWPLGWVMLRIL